MNHLFKLLLFFFTYQVITCPAQIVIDSIVPNPRGWLGHTKEYILEDSKECSIIANTADSLGLECDGDYMAVYFDATTSLCIQYTASINPCELFWVYWAAEFLGYHSTGFWTFEKGDLRVDIVGDEYGRVWSVHYYISNQLKNQE